MAKFMIRIELHDATSEQYDALYDNMRNIHVYRVIQDSTTGIWYALPRAQYHYDGTIDNRQTMINTINTALNNLNVTYEIVVTESNGSIWDGLEEVG